MSSVPDRPDSAPTSAFPTLREIASLAPAAQVAYAVRCALRVVPFLARDEKPDPRRNLIHPVEISLRALQAALAACTSTRNIPYEILNAAVQSAARAKFSHSYAVATNETIVHTAAMAAAFLRYVQGGPRPEPDRVLAVSDAIGRIEDIQDWPLASSERADLALLSHYALSDKERVPVDFFAQPLWTPSPPSSVDFLAFLTTWKDTTNRFGLLELAHDYSDWTSGRFDPDATAATIIQWYESTSILHTASEPSTLNQPNPPSPSASPTYEFKFSKSAQAALQHARSLADKSRRGCLTSSCLLFAFAEGADRQDDTCRFVRNALNRNGTYRQVFQSFLESGGPVPTSDRLNLGPGVGLATENVRRILQQACAIAERVSSSPEIHQRHLFAGLLVTDNPYPAAFERIEGTGQTVRALRTAFFSYVSSHTPGEDRNSWRHILWPDKLETDTPPPSAEAAPSPAADFLPGPAGFNSEFCGLGVSARVHDSLGVDALAGTLADLIALRETKLPLSIGLFGDWGAGKSHFMNLIDARLQARSRAAREQRLDEWCAEIVPVYFNAWHYLDTNLWASLISHIFERLFEHLRAKNDNLATVEALLEQAAGATARAAEELTLAQSARDKATAELVNAQAALAEKEHIVQGLLEPLRSLVSSKSLEQIRRDVSALTGKQLDSPTIPELEKTVQEARQRWGRLLHLLWLQPGRNRRVASVLGTVVGLPALSWAVIHSIPFLQTHLSSFWQSFLQFGSFGVTGLYWVRDFWRRANQHLASLERCVQEASQAQTARQNTPEAQAAQHAVEAANASVKLAQVRLAEAQARVRQLEEEKRNLSPERRLIRFIEQRAQSADYRGQLGLITLARRDFEALSAIFADADALARRKQPLAPQQAEKIDQLSRSVDRIVLFIDDLDRCQPAKVVEVLQAVHLLLAFPLFAVVVAVDQRCLRQCIGDQFKGLVSADEPSRANPPTSADQPVATPLDYLEKIFHIPFQLPAMSPAGYRTLIERLTDRPPAPSAPPVRSGSPSPLPAPSAPASPAPDSGPSSPLPPAPASPLAPSVSLTPPPLAEPAASPAPTDRPIGSTSLHAWERAALQEYHALIPTPRAVTRFVNTYRLVRAGVPAEEWVRFVGQESAAGEFRLAMYLLACAAGHPSACHSWFAALRASDLAHSAPPPPDESPAHAAFRTALAGLPPALRADSALLGRWLDRVERFAF